MKLHPVQGLAGYRPSEPVKLSPTSTSGLGSGCCKHLHNTDRAAFAATAALRTRAHVCLFRSAPVKQ